MSEPPSCWYAAARAAPKPASSSSTDAIRPPCASSAAASASVSVWRRSSPSCPVAYATRGYAALPPRACSPALIVCTSARRIGRISAAGQATDGVSAKSVPSAASSSLACAATASHSAAQLVAMYSA